jgi:Tat protein secretion system quality control protein TatD with DNase activity
MTKHHDIVGIGVNLAHRTFHMDRKSVIQRAFDVGVRTLVITGTSQASSQEAQRIAREYSGRLFFYRRGSPA